MAKVAFLGLGVMGFPMAGHLAAKGHDVTVYNRTFAKAEAWTKKHKGKAAKTPKEAATGHNYATQRRDKPGYQYQLESVFAARQIDERVSPVGGGTKISARIPTIQPMPAPVSAL